MLSRPLWRRQAERFHDYNAAAALGVITLRDCRYGTDPTVLRYAGSTENGSPYALKVIGARARTILSTCFPADRAGVRAGGRPVDDGRRAAAVVPVLRDLG